MSRVLIVEDEAHLAQGLRFNLEAEGHTVEVSGDGESALDRLLAKKELYDVVVLDVMLPGIDGYSLQLKIAGESSKRDLPIIVLTALEPSRTLFQKFPQVVGFMTKPFKTEELLAAAQAAVARSESKPS